VQWQQMAEESRRGWSGDRSALPIRIPLPTGKEMTEELRSRSRFLHPEPQPGLQNDFRKWAIPDQSIAAAIRPCFELVVVNRGRAAREDAFASLCSSVAVRRQAAAKPAIECRIIGQIRRIARDFPSLLPVEVSVISGLRS
jgi:hypothetical protein